MTDARIGYGTQFWLDDADGDLQQLDEILTVTPPNPQTADVEATHMLSPNRRREYIAGLIEDGEGTFSMNYVPGSASDILIRAAVNDGVERSYRIVIPDGAFGWVVEGSCIVKGYTKDIPIDDRMTAELTVRFTGASTEVAGTT